MQETKEQIEMYSMFRMIIYFTLVFEILVFTPLDSGPILGWLTRMLGKFFIFKTLTVCKITELVMVGITCIGTKARKDVKFNVKTMVFYPLLFGGTCILLCLLCHKGTWGGMLMGIPTNRCLYVLTSVLGIMAVHLGLDNISKYIRHKVGDDRFNFENESFKQETELEKNRYSVNIPMIYYFNGRMQHGWINVINPFRGTWVVGTPGSGKTFGVIEPFMRQHSEKGFSMVVYDYKFPTLAKKLFYLYCKNKTYGRTPRNCGFRIINFTDVEYSNRVNPIQAKYIDAGVAAERRRQEGRLRTVFPELGGELPRRHHLFLHQLPSHRDEGRQEASADGGGQRQAAEGEGQGMAVLLCRGRDGECHP